MAVVTVMVHRGGSGGGGVAVVVVVVGGGKGGVRGEGGWVGWDGGLREREGHSRGILPRFLPHPSSLLTSRRPQQPGTCRPPHFVRTQASPTSGTDFIGTSSR